MKRIFAAILCGAAMMYTAFAAFIPATPTREIGQTVYVNDTRVYPTAYNIAGNNYFKLRDIGKMVGFGVDWNGETQTSVRKESLLIWKACQMYLFQELLPSEAPSGLRWTDIISMSLLI